MTREIQKALRVREIILSLLSPLKKKKRTGRTKIQCKNLVVNFGNF